MLRKANKATFEYKTSRNTFKVTTTDSEDMNFTLADCTEIQNETFLENVTHNKWCNGSLRAEKFWLYMVFILVLSWDIFVESPMLCV